MVEAVLVLVPSFREIFEALIFMAVLLGIQTTVKLDRRLLFGQGVAITVAEEETSKLWYLKKVSFRKISGSQRNDKGPTPGKTVDCTGELVSD